MMDFPGMTVLVTGASGCLGSAVVQKYLEAGANVAAVDRAQPTGSPKVERLWRIQADLGTDEGARLAVAEALKIEGRIGALVHVAGGFAAGGSAPDDGAGAWARMIHLNVTLAHNVIRAALPGMVSNGSGRIVAIGSRAGFEPVAGLSAYCASKAALHMLVRCLAEEVNDAGVTVNALAPSTIDTPANRQAMPEADQSAWVAPESIADQILWLTSDAAADVSGALIPVYGRA